MGCLPVTVLCMGHGTAACQPSHPTPNFRGDRMPSKNDPTTERLIQEIQELERPSDELTDTVHHIHAELIRLREQLGTEEVRINKLLMARPHRARCTKPN